MKTRSAFIFLCITFGVFFYLGIKAPLFADDYTYAQAPIFNALGKAWEMYFTWGGRVLGHAWMIAVESLPDHVTSCIVSIFICLLFVAIHILTYGAEWKNNLSLHKLAFPAAVLFLFLPEAWETTLWRSATFYTAAGLFTCAFLIPYRFLLEGKNVFRSAIASSPFVAFAFITPFWVEIVILPALWLAAVCLFLSPKESKAGFWPLAAYIAFFLGSALTIAAPGNFARAGAAVAFDSMILIRAAASLAYKYSYTVAVPTALFLFFALVVSLGKMSGNAKRVWKTGACLFVASLLSAALLLGGGVISYRALSFAFILMLIAMNMAYGTAVQALPSLRAVPLILIGFAAFWAALTCIDYTRLKEAERQRDIAVASLKQEGKKTVFLEEYPGIRQRNFFFLDPLRGNPLPWGNVFSEAHGLEQAYLLMDPAPETLEQSAVQEWRGSLAISPTVTLRSLLVAKRNGHKVIAASFAGKTEQIKELVFLTAAADSPVQTQLARLLLPPVSSPMVVRSLPQRLFGELLDRTVILPAPNTLTHQDGIALYYAKLHPRAGSEGPLEVRLQLKIAGAPVVVQIPLGK